MFISMRQHPTAIRTILDRAKEKVNIRTNPSIESVAILAELRCPWIGFHVCVWEPGAPDCVAA
jgi:hypothetical protein